MQAFAVSYSRYVITAVIALYTVLGFAALRLPLPVKRGVEVVQRLCIAAFLITAYLTLSIVTRSAPMFTFGMIQAAIFLICALLYRRLYLYANMQMFNHICMFLSIGIAMISRINFSKGIRQFVIAAAGLIFMIFFPRIRERLDHLQRFCYFYAVVGIALLCSVLVLGAFTNGSKLNITVLGLTLQPSEFVKILFLLFLAGALCEPLTRMQLVLLSLTAAAHVGILLISRDLGSAVIFFVTYIFLLFLASGKTEYLVGGLIVGAVGAVLCYFLFSHFRVRVQVFLDPWSSIDGSGYQITQSLFAISYGGLWGAGLGQGLPSSIPFVESDFIFSAIAEEMGIIVCICLILMCILVFLDLMHLASGFLSRYYQMFVFGAAGMYLFQTFMTVGGEVKFIPLTGVTLPLVSYGGSSVLATMIMFGIVGTIFILQSEQLERFRIRYEQEQEEAAGRAAAARARAAQRQPEFVRTYTRKKARPADAGNTSGSGAVAMAVGKPENEAEKHYMDDFAGVPYYDPETDYEGITHFDV